jgi:hypothetical protein
MLIRSAHGAIPALFSHGAPRDAATRGMTPNGLTQAVELPAAALLPVMRRGYGDPDGRYAESTAAAAVATLARRALAAIARRRRRHGRRTDVTTHGMIAALFPPADMPASRCRPIRRRASPP